jgi:hypothetical protein
MRTAPSRGMRLWRFRARVMRPSDSLVRGEFHVDALPIPTRNELKERFFSSVLPVTEFAVEKRNAIQDEHSDFFDAIRQRRSPRSDGDCRSASRSTSRNGSAPNSCPSASLFPWDHRRGRSGPLRVNPLPQSTQRKAA